MEFAFRRRYGLPPTDPRFLHATEQDIVIDYWAHRHCDDPKLRDEIVTDDFEEDLARMEAEVMVDDRGDDWETVVDDKFGG